MSSFNRNRIFFDCCTRDCPERIPGCHSTCKRYKEKRAEFDKKKAIQDMQNSINSYVSEKRMNKYDSKLKRERRLGGTSIVER